MQKIILAVVLLFLGSLPMSGSNLDDQIIQKENEIKILKEKLEPMVTPLLVKDCHLRLWISKQWLTSMINSYNRLPLPQRQHTFQMTQGIGRLKDQWGGGLGCGFYVEVDSNRFHMVLTVDSLRNQWQNGIALETHFNLSGKVQLHGHVRGPACPFKSCRDCTIGNGFGSRVGTDISAQSSLSIRLHLNKQGNAFRYQIIQDRETIVPLTLHFHLNRAGNIAISTSFKLPAGIWFDGKLPEFLEYQNLVRIGPITEPILSKKYRLVLLPHQIHFIQSGLELKVNAKIEWL
jgi:hypothetical protein